MKPAICYFSRVTVRGKGRQTYLKALDAKRNELWTVRGAAAIKMKALVKTWGVRVRNV